MIERIPLPAEGKLVTLIFVAAGEPVVLFGRVLIAKERMVAVVADQGLPAGAQELRSRPVTMLFGHQGETATVRARIAETVAPDRLLISPTDEPRLGERREFIRTDLELELALTMAPAQLTREEEVGEWAASFERGPSRFRGRVATVDLSGSGARLQTPQPLRKGHFVALSLALPVGREVRLLHLPAKVVRSRPVTSDEGGADSAFIFLKMAEADSDLLNQFVFQARARQLGISDGGEQGDRE